MSQHTSFLASEDTARMASGAGRRDEISRVLHINSGNLYGGVETILITLARLRGLCPQMETHYALCHAGRLSQELEETGLPAYMLGPVRISRPWTVMRARRRLRELLGKESFDLVICHMPWSLAVFGPVVKTAGQRLGFFAHNQHDGSGWLERLASRVTPDIAIANSHFTEGGVNRLFSGVPSCVVYPPVSLTALDGAADSRAALRAQQGASPDTVVIIQVSRMEGGKGHQLHLEALARLKNLATPWVCWMVGGAQRREEQEYVDQLRQSVSALNLDGRVLFLGQRSDISGLLSASDIFCQPNLTPDSFGISFIEAMLARRPVITSAIGGGLEIVDQGYGVLFPPGDAAALTQALERLITDPAERERLAGRGPERALELCDPAKQLRALSRIPRNLEHPQ